MKSSFVAPDYASTLNRSLRFEPLEDRRMLATFMVMNNADSGVDSLRDAIATANAAPGADEITFAGSLSGQTITLTSGELAITEALTITGLGQGNLTISGNNASRIFNITATSGDFTLAGLTHTGGVTTGDNANFSDTTFSGGAVRSLTTGNLTIDQSTVSGNSTAGDYAPGGGIFSAVAITLTSSTVSGNSTAGSNARGGGIHSYGDVTLTGSTVSGNSTAGSNAPGGGISSSSGTFTLIGSTVSGNSVASTGGSGGGIFSSSAITLIGSTVSGNSGAFDGGGIWGGNHVTLTGSTVSGNSSFYFGGGIRARGNVTLTGSTISGNISSKYDGGISSFNGNITLTGSTVTGNSASWGGGVNTYANITITGSIVAGNTDTSLSINQNNPDLFHGGALVVNYSLIGDNAGTVLSEAPVGMPDGNGNLIGSEAGNGVIDPHLGPLANNGGPTETHALQSGSPAIDAGDPGFIAPPDFDQRGAPYDRVVEGRIDMGAYEVQAAVPDSADFDGSGFVTGLDFLLWQLGFGTPAPDAVKSDGDADNDQDVDGDDLDVWELQYGTGPEPLPSADFDSNGQINGFDFLAWQIGFGTPAPNATKSDGDADNDLDVDGDDLTVWENQYGTVAPLVTAASASIAAKSFSTEPVGESALANSDLVDVALAVALSEKVDGAFGKREFVASPLPPAFFSSEPIRQSDFVASPGISSSATTSTPRDDERHSPGEPSPWEDTVDKVFASVFE